LRHTITHTARLGLALLQPHEQIPHRSRSHRVRRVREARPDIVELLLGVVDSPLF
jgi:hypothetical protein